jgi:hypothetical protein
MGAPEISPVKQWGHMNQKAAQIDGRKQYWVVVL